MKVTRERYNQVCLVNQMAHDFNVASTRQRMLEHTDFRWSAIDNVIIAPRSILIVPGRNNFIHVGFDHEVERHPFAICKVSEKCTTTVFREKFSYN